MAGVTGARSGLPPGLKDFLGRTRAATDRPLSVGFGIATKEHVQAVAGMADGVVVGSAFMKAVDEVNWMHACMCMLFENESRCGLCRPSWKLLTRFWRCIDAWMHGCMHAWIGGS